MGKVLHRLRRLVVLIILFVIIMAALLWWRFLVTPVVPKNGLHFYVTPGMTAMRFAYQLQDQSPNTNPYLLGLLIKLRGDQHHLRVGEYQLTPYSTPSQVLDQVKAGSQIYHAFMIVNGWNIYDVMSSLEKDPYVQHTMRGKTLAQVAKAIGIKQTSPEGWLFPNTYFFRWGGTDVALLKRAYVAMKQYLDQQWAARAEDLPYRNEYQALIVASMIEKETAIESERPIIAAIILKRWEIWMHLQIDATVIYGLEPHFKGQLTKADLRLKTPYNTYTKYGLPPTPIAMPSPESIEAALHPANTDYLYYVAKGDGSHKFSKTLKQQNEAIKTYLK